MVCELPIESSFIRFAGRYVDDAVGVALGEHAELISAVVHIMFAKLRPP